MIPDMRPSLTRRTGRIPARHFAALGAIAMSLSCTESTRPGDDDVHFVAITVPDTLLRPGFFMQAVAEPLDAEGQPVVGRTINWRSLTPATLAVGSDGQLLALAPGEGIVRASVGSVSSQVRLALRNPPVATLTASADTLRLYLPGGSESLVAVARDEDGVEILRAPIRWEATAARIADVTVNGRVTAASAGETRIVVHAEDRADTVVVLVLVPSSPNAPQVMATTPTLALPGQSLVVAGTGFAPTPAGNSVKLDGIPVSVTAASPTQLTLALPAAAQFACVPTGPVALQVTTASGIGVGTVLLQVAPQVALAPGQSLLLGGALDARCIELAPAGGRYMIAMQNTARALGGDSIAFTLGGALTALGGGAVQGGAQAPLVSPGRLAGAPTALRGLRTDGIGRSAADARQRAAAAAHARIFERAAVLMGPGTASRTAVPRSADLQVPTVGEVVNVRVADLDRLDFCAVYRTIGARAVFVGPRVIILEDTVPQLNGAPTLQGTMDAPYAQIGAEFESVVWPLLARFGDPLAMDDRLDANGKVVLVFTPRMNQMLGGAALAATVPCDFFSRAQQPSSNVGEFVYAQVPTSAEPIDAPGTIQRWLREIRGTVAHEMKHVVSFAERQARGQLLEDFWLEEATARMAEEFFARAVYGTQQLGNHGFGATLACEVGSGCLDSPRAMLPHLDGLWDFLGTPGVRSPLGPTTFGDFSFYGSGWSLLRWVLDHSGADEQTFLRALTTSGLRGADNLEVRAGRPWPQLISEWTLALAVDDRPGLVPESATLRFPSWDLPDLFNGLCDALGPCAGGIGSGSGGSTRYTRGAPLQPVQRTAGDFAVEFPRVVAGSFGAVELSGGSAFTRQLLHLRGYRGSALAPSARLTIIRVQ